MHACMHACTHASVHPCIHASVHPPIHACIEAKQAHEHAIMTPPVTWEPPLCPGLAGKAKSEKGKAGKAPVEEEEEEEPEADLLGVLLTGLSQVTLNWWFGLVV